MNNNDINTTGINFEKLHPRTDGGEFTEKAQTSADIELTAADVNTVEDSETVAAARDYAIEIRDSNPRVSREGSAALYAEIERTVRNLRRKTGLNETEAQDAVNDTFADLYARIDHGHTVEGGLVQIAANAVCSRYVNGPVRHETAKAIRILKQRVSEEEARVGHHLSSSTIAKMAALIRMGDDFNPRHRPVEEFHLIENFVNPTSFSQFPASYIDEQMLTFGYGEDREFSGMGSASDRLAEEFENDEVKKAEVLKRLWEVMASDNEVPQATPGRIGRQVSADMQAFLKDQVVVAARFHEDGIENKHTVALFAPFAELTPRDKDGVSALLLSHSTHAEHLWTSAVTAATRTREAEATMKREAKAKAAAAKSKTTVAA